MDFRTVPEVSRAPVRRQRYTVFSATVKRKEGYFEAIRRTGIEKHFNWNPKAEWLIKTPGVVFAIAAAVRAYHKAEGDGVLIQQPVYYPFSVKQSRTTGACR